MNFIPKNFILKSHRSEIVNIKARSLGMQRRFIIQSGVIREPNYDSDNHSIVVVVILIVIK